LVNIPLVGVPNNGVTNVGLVANTNEPVPVSSVTAVIKLALDGVAKNVAIPVAKPETPVDIGKPVALVNVTDVGVPKVGDTNVGDVDKTTVPEPVDAFQLAFVPSVVRYLLLLPVWVGKDAVAADPDIQVVPSLTKILPAVPGATVCTALVPLPNRTLLAANVAAPVPPLLTANVELSPAAVPVVF
jgi:hypothetical protein